MLETNNPIEILVCNDDGITAPGIQNLIAVAKDFGSVLVVAPDSPQSGMGHAISVGKPLRLNKVKRDDQIPAYACSGTPVDCIKLATGEILHHKPQLVVSGINHGANSSISVVYSGTMSAAMEAAIEGIPAIGFSLCDFGYDADFSLAKEVCATVIREVLKHGLLPGTLLNVNIPAIPKEHFKGIKITRQSVGRWVEEFDRRVDPHGRPYYWLTGKFHLQDEGEDTDEWALRNGYASVCPVQFDLTAHHFVPQLNTWHWKI